MLSHLVQTVTVLALGGIAIYVAIRIVKYRNSDSWPVTVGHVESYGRFRHLDDNGRASLSFVDVSYSYSVNGEFYSGQWLSPTLQNDQALSDFLADNMPIGKSLTIQYMPSHPDRSILADGPQPEPSGAPIKLGL